MEMVWFTFLLYKGRLRNVDVRKRESKVPGREFDERTKIPGECRAVVLSYDGTLKYDESGRLLAIDAWLPPSSPCSVVISELLDGRHGASDAPDCGLLIDRKFKSSRVSSLSRDKLYAKSIVLLAAACILPWWSFVVAPDYFSFLHPNEIQSNVYWCGDATYIKPVDRQFQVTFRHLHSTLRSTIFQKQTIDQLDSTSTHPNQKPCMSGRSVASKTEFCKWFSARDLTKPQLVRAVRWRRVLYRQRSFSLRVHSNQRPVRQSNPFQTTRRHSDLRHHLRQSYLLYIDRQTEGQLS
ncbi:hypothetical protein R1flu_011541 [Riccia fluitans]|uniref:Uncharacterized protein n=1 Tax=Riccia fluitans TaxID=41844 RepID=A0ABD1ZAP9_9MARC